MSCSLLIAPQTAVAVRNQICCCDPRSGQVHSTIKTAVSSGSVRAMDFNPNRESVLASSGDDGILRLWDLRQSQKPVSLVAIGKGEGPTAGPNETHAHEVTCLKFHPFYDQLLATASSDGTARVWMIPEAAFEVSVEQQRERLTEILTLCIRNIWLLIPLLRYHLCGGQCFQMICKGKISVVDLICT